MGWIVALPALAVLYVINKRVNPRGKSRDAVAVATIVIAFIVGTGLTYTWVGSLVGWSVGWTGKLSTAIPLALAIVAVGSAAADIAYDRKADSVAQIAAVAFPILVALTIAGAMHHTGGNAVHATYMQMASFVTTHIGTGK